MVGLLLLCWAFCQLPAETKFSNIYRLNLWFSRVSRSGDGSTLENTAVIRGVLLELLPRQTNFLDVPCGDFHWMREVRARLPGFDTKYVGMDVVPSIISANSRAFPTVTFKQGDAGTTQEQYDLILMRDLLQHLCTAKQMRILNNLRASGSSLLLVNYEPDVQQNRTVHADPAPDWFPFNLELPPFSLRPLQTFASDGKDKHYGLFELKSLPPLHSGPADS